MRPVSCYICGQNLSTDEVALNQRLLGMQTGAFLCVACLGEKLGTTPEHLRILIGRFKEMGCVYFTRLMEGTSDEKEHDSL